MILTGFCLLVGTKEQTPGSCWLQSCLSLVGNQAACCAVVLSLSGGAPDKLTAEMMEKEVAAAPEDALRPIFA